MLQDRHCQSCPNLQSGYFVRIPACHPFAPIALQDRIPSFTWATVLPENICLHKKVFGGYSCSVAAKSATGFEIPNHRRMHRLFKNWRFFCAQSPWKQNVHRLTLPNRFLACRVGSLVLAGPMTGISTHSMRLFCLRSEKVKQSLFIGAMS